MKNEHKSNSEEKKVNKQDFVDKFSTADKLALLSSERDSIRSVVVKTNSIFIQIIFISATIASAIFGGIYWLKKTPLNNEDFFTICFSVTQVEIFLAMLAATIFYARQEKVGYLLLLEYKINDLAKQPLSTCEIRVDRSSFFKISLRIAILIPALFLVVLIMYLFGISVDKIDNTFKQIASGLLLVLELSVILLILFLAQLNLVKQYRAIRTKYDTHPILKHKKSEIYE